MSVDVTKANVYAVLTQAGVDVTKANVYAILTQSGVDVVKANVYAILNDAGISLNDTLADGSRSVAYSQTIAATGGSGTYDWSIVEGTLPPGLTISGATATGTISGTPTISGTYTFTVQVNNVKLAGRRAYSVTVSGASRRPVVVCS